MTYSSQPPSDAIYQIQKRQLPTGNASDWVVIRIYYPVPNVVTVKVTNTTRANILVPGFQQVNGAYPDLTTHTTTCGANFYDFDKNVINFVVNGRNNCQVRLILSSYVQLTVRFLVEMATFYSNNGPTSMLTNIIAFLKIDPSQIKVVAINAAAQRFSSGLYGSASSQTDVTVSILASDAVNNNPSKCIDTVNPDNCAANVSDKLDAAKAAN
jgi:hypothetical protein